MEPLRILLADDHILFRKGLANLLHDGQDLVVVGEANDGLEAMALARQTAPDVILMDIVMPRQDGIETTKLIKREMPQIQIVMLTVSDNDHYLYEAIKSGASGYLLKDLDPQDLYLMLDRLRRGEAAISGGIAAKILQQFQMPEQKLNQPVEESQSLTARELEVLEWVVAGASNIEIAEHLNITVNTVKIHVRNILEKLHVQNRLQAAVSAVCEGLVKEAEHLSG